MTATLFYVVSQCIKDPLLLTAVFDRPMPDEILAFLLYTTYALCSVTAIQYMRILFHTQRFTYLMY